MKTPESSPGRGFLAAAAWAFMLLVSDLPEIVLDLMGRQAPVGLFWAKIALIVLVFALGSAWKRLQPLRPFAFILLVLFLALKLSAGIGDSGWWQGRFGGPGVSYFKGYLGFALRDIAVMVVVIAALWALKRRRSAFFLVRGDLGAPVEPVRWLGIRGGETWRSFTWIFALAAGAIVLVVTLLSLKAAPGAWAGALPLLPAVLFFAALNGLNEEISLRASFLSTLPEAVGKNQALLLSSVFFGLAHWLQGSPAGLPGFLLTGFLAWLMGKAMLETRGLLAPWIIHVVPDAVIFFSYALIIS
jgi:membrane protease YdiL (CAAX protease family)